MSNTVRQTIIGLINTGLQAILVSGGYATNLGNSIHWWRDLENNSFAAAEIPAANVKDNPDEIGYHAMSRDSHLMMVEIYAVSSTVEQIRQIVADIEKAVNANRTWTTNALTSKVLSDQIDVEHREDKYWGVTIPIEIYFVTVAGDPTTKG